MALDPTARLTNIKDSIKKFFVDSLYTSENIPVIFDRFAPAEPNIQSKSVNRWVSIVFGDMDRFGSVSNMMLQIYCCTRQDTEGFRLAQLSDTVMGYLTDTSMSDCHKRIPFYRSHPSDPWTLLGSLVVQSIGESPSIELPDKTKYRQFSCEITWAAKI